MADLNDTVAQTAAHIAAEIEQFTFSTADYIVFIVMLSVSAGIGIYFGFFAKAANTTDEFLLGGRKMKPIPIAISLITSQSGISFMSMPAEIYAFGINGGFIVAAMVLVMPILCWIVIPVFYDNHISNCYQYLQMRFNSQTRKLLSFAFVVTSFLLLPIFMFIPALAFSQVTGINIHVINTIVCSICIFYTMLGGIKAGVWADVVQAALMVLTVVLVTLIGAHKAGGFVEVFRIAGESNRLDVDFTLDLTTRATFWNCFLGSTVVWTAYIGLNQGNVQRIVSQPTLKDGQKSILYFGVGFLLVMGINCLIGVIMFARYINCDPIAAGYVQKADKLVPYFVQDVLGHLKGMPGIFISCVFSAALSTLSAGLNSLSGVVYFEYIKPRIQHTESRANFIMKSFVLATGVYCIMAGVVVEKSKSILQMLYAIGGLTFGAIFGVFFLGMLVPKAHGRAAFWSVLASTVATFSIFIGAGGLIKYKPYLGSVESCPATNVSSIASNATTLVSLITQQASTPSAGFDIFQLSFNWYVVFGAIIVFVVGMALSYMMDPDEGYKYDPKLLSSLVKPHGPYKLAPPEELPEVTTKLNLEQ